MTTKIIAHRGASYLAKHGNTMEAFMIAIDLKADYAEFDIRRTKDKQLVVFHDESINSILISHLTYDELLDITHKDNYEIPLLSDVLSYCKGKIKLDIEIKEVGYETSIINMVTKYYGYDDFIIKSFFDEVVHKVNTLDLNITTGLLIGIKKNSFLGRLSEYYPVKRANQCNASFISPHYKLCTNRYIKRLKKHNFKIYPWTVNSPKYIQQLINKKVDGIITDRPDIAIQIKNKLNKII